MEDGKIEKADGCDCAQRAKKQEASVEIETYKERETCCGFYNTSTTEGERIGRGT
jgi:hypothetical protein